MRTVKVPENIYHGRYEPEQYECVYYKKLDQPLRCEFVRTEICDFATGSLNYLVLMCCTMASAEWFGLTLVILNLVFLFLTLGTSADQFFCPSLEAMSTFMRMSQTVAGVTILALGNGAIDVFTSIAASQVENGEEMVFGELLGAGLFVTTIVAGLIMLVRPFRVDIRPFLRDCLFIIIAGSYEFYIFYNEEITVAECVGCLVIYTVYILTAIFEAFFVRWEIKKEVSDNWILEQYRTISSSYELDKRVYDSEEDEVESDEKSLTETPSVPGMLTRPRYRHHRGSERPVQSGMISTIKRGNFFLPPPTAAAGRTVSRMARLDAALRAERLNVLSLVGLHDEVQKERKIRFDTPSTGSSRTHITRKPTGLFMEFLYEILPFGLDDWQASTFLEKVYFVIEAPVIFALKLVVPVVNQASKKCGWSKLLNTMHCITTTMYFCWGTGLLFVHVYSWVYGWVIALTLGSILAVVVFATSSKAHPPVYHIVYAFAGFAASILTLYIVAQDVVALLYTLGVIFNLSDAILGLSLLAFGNSIGDLSANISIAKAGFERMGFSACFGGPLFTNLFGLGVSLLWSMHKHKRTELVVSVTRTA